MRNSFQFIFSALLVGLSFNATSAPRHPEVLRHKTHVIEVFVSSKQERSRLASLGVAIEDMKSDRLYVFGDNREYQKILRAGFRVNVYKMRPDWLNANLRPDFANPIYDSARPGKGKNNLLYHSTPEVELEMAKLAVDAPNIVSYLQYGKTHENRTLKMLRISSKTPAQAEAQKIPAIFYVGCHHAREHLSVEVPLMFAQYLVQNYGKDANITRLVDTREIFISPILNPDGHTYDFKGNKGNGVMWRKNRRDNKDGTYGVDLNRNYGFMWGTGGSSKDTSSDVYMGTTPFSEPETQALRDFVSSKAHRMKVLLSFHTFSELILYPWGHTFDKIGAKAGNKEDLPVFEKMARTMAGWNKYKPQQSSELYIASGDTTDWAYGQHGIFAFTFELTPSSMWGGGFYPNPKVISPTFEANLKPMLYMLEYADNPKRVLTEKAPRFLATPALAGIGIASFDDVSL